jgi:hypothetical protein
MTGLLVFLYVYTRINREPIRETSVVRVGSEIDGMLGNAKVILVERGSGNSIREFYT